MKQMAEYFDLTQRTVFGLLAHNLFGVPFSPEDGVNWEEVFRESRAQAVGAQVFADSNQLYGMPDELRSKIKTYLFKSMLKNAQVHAQHTYMHKLLSEYGIAYVTLKGAVSARYYPDPQNRTMGDVDFCVNKADFERALAVFQEDGFEISGMDHICHVVLRKNGMYMEMHHTPAGVPDGDVREVVCSYLSDLSASASLMESNMAVYNCPSDFHHGLIMLMHLQHHMVAEGVGLRHLCDWAVFVNHFQGDAFPALFREKLKAIGLWKLARLLSMCAVLYLGLPKQDWMQENSEDEDVAQALMKDILVGGNFGKKDKQRAYEGVLISNSSNDAVQRSHIGEGFRALNRITQKKYPCTEKWPILLPFGWLVAFGGYSLRAHRRNKRGANIHALSAYQKSTQRLQVYKPLELYEPEA